LACIEEECGEVGASSAAMIDVDGALAIAGGFAVIAASAAAIASDC
jgi:hypothetical protein